MSRPKSLKELLECWRKSSCHFQNLQGITKCKNCLASGWRGWLVGIVYRVWKVLHLLESIVYYTKTVDSVFRSLWLATQSVNIAALFTDSPPVPLSEWHQTRVSCEQNAFLVCCRNKQRNFTTNQASCSQNTRGRWRSSVWKF